MALFLARCNSPLGLEDKSIPDSDITASSEWDRYHCPKLARLNTVETGLYQGAWSAKFRIPGEWLQV